MSDVEKAISKSLDEIDTLVASFNNPDISKGLDKKDEEEPTPEDVSAEAPAPDDDEGNSQGTPDDQVDDGGDDGSAEDEGADEDKDEDYGKSLSDELGGSETVKKALEVSEFLKDLVKGLNDVLTAHGSKLNKSLDSSFKSQELLAKSFEGIVKSQKVILQSQSELSKSIQALGSRLQKVEEQPLVRKSQSSAAKVQEKSFTASTGGAITAGASLTKSQAVQKLAFEFDKGNTSVMHDILALEGTGDLNSLSPIGKSILGIN